MRRVVNREGKPVGKEPFNPVVLNVVSDNQKVGEVRLVECAACFALVNPYKTEQHFKHCVERKGCF